MDWLGMWLKEKHTDENEYHTEYGKLCGYPKCCIKFFIALGEITDSQALVADLVYGIDDLDIEYVRCPKCREVIKDADKWVLKTRWSEMVCRSCE